MSNTWPVDKIVKRIRVISDNDFGGDPDGLIQLAHHALSPSVDLVAVVGSRLRDGDAWSKTDDSVQAAVDKAKHVLKLAGVEAPVFAGGRPAMSDVNTPVDSEGVQAIIREAMKDDDRPLYVVCGGGLTQIASAYLIEPRIAERLIMVWIGGHEYEGSPVAPGGPDMEYNLAIDPIAGQVVFNHSNLKLWHIPRETYRQAIVSRAELKRRFEVQGELGAYLFSELGTVAENEFATGYRAGETYCFGDSVLVVVTALQAMYEADASSNAWIEAAAPMILPSGLYKHNRDGRTIRIFTRVDNRLMMEDLYAKLEMHALGQS